MNHAWSSVNVVRWAAPAPPERIANRCRNCDSARCWAHPRNLFTIPTCRCSAGCRASRRKRLLIRLSRGRWMWMLSAWRGRHWRLRGPNTCWSRLSSRKCFLTQLCLSGVLALPSTSCHARWIRRLWKVSSRSARLELELRERAVRQALPEVWPIIPCGGPVWPVFTWQARNRWPHRSIDSSRAIRELRLLPRPLATCRRHSLHPPNTKRNRKFRMSRGQSNILHTQCGNQLFRTTSNSKFQCFIVRHNTHFSDSVDLHFNDTVSSVVASRKFLSYPGPFV